jgi:hypothetical protein
MTWIRESGQPQRRGSSLRSRCGEAVGPVYVKGVSEPVEVFEVAGAGSVRTRLQAARLSLQDCSLDYPFSSFFSR